MPEEEDVEFPWTAPADVRFAQQGSGTRYCFQMFVDYQRCTRLFGEGHTPCEYFQKAYYSICPTFWVDKWMDQLKEGTFPVKLPEVVKSEEQNQTE